MLKKSTILIFGAVLVICMVAEAWAVHCCQTISQPSQEFASQCPSGWWQVDEPTNACPPASPYTP